jgi:uncharacterized membrane protein
MAQLDYIPPALATDELPVARTLRFEDLRDALKKGLDDFWAIPTHRIPVLDLSTSDCFIRVCFVYDLLPLFLTRSRFALLGPFAAIASTNQPEAELGMDTSWLHAFDIIHSPSLLHIVALGCVLMAIFGAWIAVANVIYAANFGDQPLTSPLAFANQVFTTPEGRSLIIAGNVAGFVFALLAASVSVVSFPLLLDRNVGFRVAILTSVKLVVKNPVVMATWFLIVAGGLLIGSLPLLVGLAVVLPVLGHSTWHLYRRAIEPDLSPRPEYHPRQKGKRFAADFPASLFAAYRDKEGDKNEQ